MREVFLPFVLALAPLIGCVGSAQSREAIASTRVEADHSADLAEIKSLAATYQAGFLEGNASKIAALYADDAIIHPANQPPVRGRRDLDAYFAANFNEPVNETLTTVAVVISAAGDMAYEVGSTMSATGAGKYLTVYRKTNGRWRIAADTWSHDTPP